MVNVRLLSCGLLAVAVAAQEPRQIAGVYPHLAMFNDEGECGTGAVVPWAGRLWAITYAPHKPQGSSDKLYEITPELRQIVRPESIGGTPANRLIHVESKQLFVGPYVIDAQGAVRVIPYSRMFGRPTGTARHLLDPAGKVYVATMEEGLYEVDVSTLDVTELWADEQRREGRHAGLPGYHGKGLYSGQGRLVYANNGEHGEAALREPTTPSGVLAEWDGKAEAWAIVRRNQFTEVTGPGGIEGNADAAKDPIWSIGWDHRSLLLQVLDAGVWHSYRLPKGSHSYDGAHGWNTEWPRIRDIGEDGLLMTMHGLFWRFPRDFGPGRTAGIVPRSAYLKVIGDFCRWQDRIVFGCDDTAKSEFLNKRRAKGEIAAPRSQSNLWFVAPERLGSFGPVRAVGGVWVHEDVAVGTVSEPFLVNSFASQGLVAGFAHRGLHLAHRGDGPVEVVVEADADGSGTWRVLREVVLPPRGYAWLEVDFAGLWVRLRAKDPLQGAVAYFHLAGEDGRSEASDLKFDGLAPVGHREALGALVRARGGQETSLAVAPLRVFADRVEEAGAYELQVDADGAGLRLEPSMDAGLAAHTLANAAIPSGVVDGDAASLLYVDDAGGRWRLPRVSGVPDLRLPFAVQRACREVATERDLFHAGGTFFELPADNAGGFAKVRPVASHGYAIHDYCSWRGLLVLSGIHSDALPNERIVRSADGKAAVWLGVVDELWQLGKVRGVGGPWLDTLVVAGLPSDPYLMTGYDQKLLELSHRAERAVTITLEADLCGDGRWTVLNDFVVPSGETVRHHFSRAWSAYWVRLRSDTPCTASAQFTYR
jgi:hypothetical protein